MDTNEKYSVAGFMMNEKKKEMEYHDSVNVEGMEKALSYVKSYIDSGFDEVRVAKWKEQ